MRGFTRPSACLQRTSRTDTSGARTPSPRTHSHIQTPDEYSSSPRSNFNAKRLLDTPIDPKGGYVIASRIRVARNIRGYRLPPSCSAEERRALEAVIATALGRLQSEAQGDYFPLSGSESYELKPGGLAPEQVLSLPPHTHTHTRTRSHTHALTHSRPLFDFGSDSEQEDGLRKANLLFHEPTTPALIAGISQCDLRSFLLALTND